MIQCDNCGSVFISEQLFRLHSCKTVSSKRKKSKIKNSEMRELINELTTE